MIDFPDITDSPPVTILEATNTAQDHYGWAYGGETLALTGEEIEALHNGKMLALPINRGEYVLFIVRKPDGLEGITQNE